MLDVIDPELAQLRLRRERLQDRIDNYEADREVPPGYQASLDATEALIQKIEQRQTQTKEQAKEPQQTELPFYRPLRYPTLK